MSNRKRGRASSVHHFRRVVAESDSVHVLTPLPRIFDLDSSPISVVSTQFGTGKKNLQQELFHKMEVVMQETTLINIQQRETIKKLGKTVTELAARGQSKECLPSVLYCCSVMCIGIPDTFSADDVV